MGDSLGFEGAGYEAHDKSCSPSFAGNLSFGVSIGTHRETETEIYQFSDDRYRHTIIIGRTGAGKSNHITQLERQDIRNGAGVFILAAHEDDALYPLACVPDERLDEVVFLDASNPEYLPNMNPLDIDTGNPMEVSRAVEDVLELVTMDSHESWAGPRFEHYLRNGIGLILGDPTPANHCIAELNDVFTNPEHVKNLLKFTDDKSVFDFWTKVFPGAQHSKDAGDITAWFLAKVSRFATDRTLKHVFGAGKSTVDIQDVVDNGRILVAYVPETRIGTVAARTISKWLLMQLRNAIMNRHSGTDTWNGMNYWAYEGGRSASDDLQPFVVYVDEFTKFPSRDFESLLAEARKQHVGFVLSTQTLAQTHAYDIKTDMAGRLEEIILGNVGSFICYPVGVKDAELLARQFDVDVSKVMGIERYRPLARLCIDNQVNRPGTLDVARRRKPDNPTAIRRTVEMQVLSGTWTEVDDAPNRGACLWFLHHGKTRSL